MVVYKAACDIFGNKINYELDFVRTPSLSELKGKCSTVFGALMGRGGFSLHYIQIFHPIKGVWEQLRSHSQLRDGCQLYVFQKDNKMHESQAPIPTAIKPPVSSYHPPASVAAHSPVHQRRSLSPVAAVRKSLSPSRGKSAAPVPTTPARAASVAAMPPVVSLSPIPNPATTHADKVRIVFNAMLGEASSTADDEAFRNLFAMVRIKLDPAVITSLFNQADANQDDLISYPEWQRFSETYPTMIDSLHSRLRDFWKSKEFEHALEDMRKRMADLEESHLRIQHGVSEAEKATQAARDRVAQQQGRVDEAKAKERDAKAILDASKQETERARGTVGQRAGEVAHSQDLQKKQMDAVQTATARLNEQQQNVSQLQQETLQAERRVEELRRMLEEAENALANQREREEAGCVEQDNRQRSLEDANGAHEEALTTTQLAMDKLSVSEQALATAQTREEECGVAHLQSRDEVNRELLRLEEEEQELRVVVDSEVKHHDYAADSAHNLQQREAELKALTDEINNHEVKRDADEENELPMLEQEIRLRQQRLNLEQEEAKLRNEHKSFQTSTGRAQ
eukprot:TRINITY_DN33543_c0_g1_i1.p1 TRINITY_DN33543_c0_g1~~TRINITY_DN33543_c0_g1_i1.p1  ORF type:complete len:569 (+),score=118.95 TRINITY_DN33543_c0_g1_i1:50-1756(+)